MGRTQHQPGRLILLLACQSPPPPSHRPPPAWELWDLGQAAAADRSSLTRCTRQTCEHCDGLTPPPHTSTGRHCVRHSSPEVGSGRWFKPSAWRLAKEAQGREASREPFPVCCSICPKALGTFGSQGEIVEIRSKCFTCNQPHLEHVFQLEFLACAYDFLLHHLLARNGFGGHCAHL